MFISSLLFYRYEYVQNLQTYVASIRIFNNRQENQVHRYISNKLQRKITINIKVSKVRFKLRANKIEPFKVHFCIIREPRVYIMIS